MELVELASDVFACLQEDKGLGCANSGLLNRAGGLVVDTFWDLPHTREMMSLYARVWREPARRIVNTHNNGDHVWGNQCFPGAEIWAHRRCADRFHQESPRTMQALRAQTGSPDPAIATFARLLQAFDWTGVVPTPPNRVFDGERAEIELEGLRVELLAVGPAHTAGDVLVHLPERRIVFAGDVLFRLCTPIGWEGTTDGWVRALDRLIALDPAVIVPGHGPLCGVEGPREMKAYLEYVRAESKRFFEANVPSVEAARRIDLGPYAGWTDSWRIVFNVDRAYRELRGEPWDAPIDALRLFREGLAIRGERG